MKDERAFQLLFECVQHAKNDIGWTYYQTVDPNSRTELQKFAAELDDLLRWLADRRWDVREHGWDR